MGGIYNFTAVQLYPSIADHGPLAIIYTFTGVCVLSTIFLIVALPETLGKTKAEIEKQFWMTPSVFQKPRHPSLFVNL